MATQIEHPAFVGEFTEYDPSTQSFMTPFPNEYDGPMYSELVCFDMDSYLTPDPVSVDPAQMQFHGLQLSSESFPEVVYGAPPSFCSPVLLRGTSPSDENLSPASPYVSLSSGEMSISSAPSSHPSRSSGSQSPPFPASVPRSHRYTPMPSAAARKSLRKKAVKQEESDDEFDADGTDDFADTVSPIGVSGGAGTEYRRETVRKQRIESEQRRRDELRDGYRRLKEALPTSGQKASKAALLDRATTHVRLLESTTAQLQAKLAKAEAEVARLHRVNEALMLGTAEHRHAAAVAAAAKLSY